MLCAQTMFSWVVWLTSIDTINIRQCVSHASVISYVYMDSIKVNTTNKRKKSEKFHSFSNSNHFIEREREKAKNGISSNSNSNSNSRRSSSCELLTYNGDSTQLFMISLCVCLSYAMPCHTVCKTANVIGSVCLVYVEMALIAVGSINLFDILTKSRWCW